MLQVKTEKEVNAIVKNTLGYCKGKSKRLTKASYNFIMLSSGFIAHYNIDGFLSEYNANDLAKAIIQNKPFNQWNNFTELDRDYRYYMQKKVIYNSICDALKGD